MEFLHSSMLRKIGFIQFDGNGVNSISVLDLEDETDDEEEPDFQADFSEGVGDSDSSSDGLHTD